MPGSRDPGSQQRPARPWHPAWKHTEKHGLLKTPSSGLARVHPSQKHSARVTARVMQNPPAPPQKPDCCQSPPAPHPAQTFGEPQRPRPTRRATRRGRAWSIQNQWEQEGSRETGVVFGRKGPLGTSRRWWWGWSLKWPWGATVTPCGVGIGMGEPHRAQLPTASPLGPVTVAPVQLVSPTSSLGRAGCSSAPLSSE